MCNLKRCNYCQRDHPSEDFVLLSKGRFGRSKIPMCGPCHRRRKDTAKNKAEFASMVESAKLSNSRAYGNFEKEKSR